MIYVLEDDDGIRSLILYALETSRLDAQGFSTPKEFYEALANKVPSCVVLDIMLPEEDGLSILKKLRSRPNTKYIPIIMLTALDSESDKIKGLEYGADDYVVKPFSALELLARIKALLRRAFMGQRSNTEFLDLVFSKSDYSVSIKDKPIHLTLKEFDLFGLLINTPNRVFTRDELLDIIWGYNSSSSRTVDIHINTLRAKLGEYAQYIKTIRGVGYMFDTSMQKEQKPS